MGDADRTGPRRDSAGSGDGALFDTSTELGRDYAAVDWAATPLGPVEVWPASLKNTVRLMISSRFAMWMGWGPELVFFCNDDYRRDTLASKYPWALGRPAREVWAEIWPEVYPRIESVMTTGSATWDEGLMLFLERSGYAEETYHTFSYSPLTDDVGAIVGMLCVVSEDTGRVVSERRITTLRDLGSDLGRASTEAEVLAAAQRQLATDPYDMPFVLAYLLDDDRQVARRTWAVGIASDHPAAPYAIDPADPASPWADAYPRGTATQVIDIVGRFADLPTGAWTDLPTRALAVPLAHVGERPYGFLIIAANRHRPLDEDYLGFVDLLTTQIASAITRARAFEAERRRAEQMAELDRAKTTFFTNVSHELRTPLTLLLGPAEDALADTELPATQRGRVEVIHRNGERLLKLVNTLLDFSRLESGRMQARFEPIDLSRYTVELASMFDAALTRAGLRLSVVSGPLPARVYVDREMWAKIVMNLVSNALKATFDGGITVRVEAAGTGARLSVADTGIGISVADQEHLFERFHRVTGAALRTHEGSGIGLALVAELAALHGGQVGVESTLGVGSTFTVTIPTGAEHLPVDRVVHTVAEDVPGTANYGAGYLAEAMRWLDISAAPSTPVEDDSGRPRVLIADDNADMRDYVSGLLANTYRVTSVADGAIALEAARANPPDLILTDVMMPNLDGFGLLAALSTDPDLMHIPVVMLSARSGDDAAVEGLEAGADDYLVKPFSARELRARVRANLELDRIRRLVDEIERSRTLLAHAEELARVGSYDYDVVNDSLVGSAQYHRLLGTTPGDIVENGFGAVLQMVHPDDLARVEAKVRETFATAAPLDVEFRLTDVRGNDRVLWVNGAVELGLDGTPVRVKGSAQDVTERRRGEEAMAAAVAARQAELREHEIATELQRSLLPPRTFESDHLDVATYYQAGVEGTEVGGDWYDVIDLDAGRTALVLGDVMGRGVRAAAVMGQLRAAVRAYARLDIAPDHLLHLLDAAVRDINKDTIVTCVYAVYDPADHSLVYANAGHLPPLLTVPGEGVRRLVAGGPPLGTGRTWTRSERVILPLDSLLTMYTDGLVETRDTDIDSGINELAALLGQLSGPIAELPDRLVATLRSGGSEDDIAVLVAHVSPRTSDEQSAELGFDDASDEIVRVAREFATDQLRGWGVEPGDAYYDVELIVSELVTNAVRHGQAPVRLRMRRSGERLFIDVHDGAAAPPQMRHASAADESGRGLLIVATLSERWGTRHIETGKSVWCLVRLR